jgi:hypothetical protein
MLEKKPGIRQLSTLRAILLYEADFNQNNKRLGNMLATDQSLNKTLTFDLFRQNRQ